MIVAFPHQRGGMAQVASGRDRRGTSQCAIRPCRQGLWPPGSEHCLASAALLRRVSPVSIHRQLRAAGPPS